MIGLLVIGITCIVSGVVLLIFGGFKAAAVFDERWMREYDDEENQI